MVRVSLKTGLLNPRQFSLFLKSSINFLCQELVQECFQKRMRQRHFTFVRYSHHNATLLEIIYSKRPFQFLDINSNIVNDFIWIKAILFVWSTKQTPYASLTCKLKLLRKSNNSKIKCYIGRIYYYTENLNHFRQLLVSN